MQKQDRPHWSTSTSLKSSRARVFHRSVGRCSRATTGRPPRTATPPPAAGASEAESPDPGAPPIELRSGVGQAKVTPFDAWTATRSSKDARTASGRTPSPSAASSPSTRDGSWSAHAPSLRVIHRHGDHTAGTRDGSGQAVSPLETWEKTKKKRVRRGPTARRTRVRRPGQPNTPGVDGSRTPGPRSASAQCR